MTSTFYYYSPAEMKDVPAIAYSEHIDTITTALGNTAYIYRFYVKSVSDNRTLFAFTYTGTVAPD